MNGGRGAVGYFTGGWGISGTSIFQSGYPMTPENTNGFLAVCASGALSNVPVLSRGPCSGLSGGSAATITPMETISLTRTL